MSPARLMVRDPVQVVASDLLVEFEGSLTRETISVLASEEVRVFNDVAVREFVPILAWRRARTRAWALAWNGTQLDAAPEAPSSSADGDDVRST